MIKQVSLNDILGKNLKEDKSHISLNILKQEEHYFNGILHIKNICDKDTFFWTVEGELHHEEDYPAFCFLNKLGLFYAKNGEFHRDNDQPASLMYNQNGGLAIQSWFKNGEIHRDNDQPAIINFSQGKKKMSWYENGYLHRDNDKPAFIDHGFNVKEYWNKGKKHREKGYAVILNRGGQYFLNNIELTEKEFNKAIKIKNF